MKIIVCCPGENFSGKFVRCITNLIAYFESKDIKYKFSFGYSKNIYESRNKLLLGAPNRSEVFLGDEYDYILWIDDDITFSIEDLEKLLNAGKEVIGGLYLMVDGKQYAAVKFWDENFFQENGHFDFLTEEDIKGRTHPIRVEYTGFGFLLIKNGVFEKLSYPWFEPTMLNIGNSYDFSMEDVTFCLKCKNVLKMPVFVHPKVIVGHNKTIELR